MKLSQQQLRSIIGDVITEAKAKKKKATATKKKPSTTSSKEPDRNDELVKQVEDALKLLIKLTPRVTKYLNKLYDVAENNGQWHAAENLNDVVEQLDNMFGPQSPTDYLKNIRSKVAAVKRNKSKAVPHDVPEDATDAALGVDSYKKYGRGEAEDEKVIPHW